MAPDGFAALVSGLDYPMFVVTTAAGDDRSGCLVGFVTQASIDPPRLLVCLSEKNHTCATAARAEHLVVHVLGDRNEDLARLFGEHTEDDGDDKFARCVWWPGPGGAAVLAGTNGWVGLRIIDRHGVGDHVAFLGDVVEAEHEADHPPLSFQRVRYFDPGHPA